MSLNHQVADCDDDHLVWWPHNKHTTTCLPPPPRVLVPINFQVALGGARASGKLKLRFAPLGWRANEQTSGRRGRRRRRRRPLREPLKCKFTSVERGQRDEPEFFPNQFDFLHWPRISGFFLLVVERERKKHLVSLYFSISPSQVTFVHSN